MPSRRSITATGRRERLTRSTRCFRGSIWGWNSRRDTGGAGAAERTTVVRQIGSRRLSSAGREGVERPCTGGEHSFCSAPDCRKQCSDQEETACNEAQEGQHQENPPDRPLSLACSRSTVSASPSHAFVSASSG